jgi:hypothetical protein
MTREEQIKEAALKKCSSFDLPDKEGKFKGVNSAYGLGFCEGAMWADANPYINWQQVRIQAAIAAMQGITSNPYFTQEFDRISKTVKQIRERTAIISVEFADALVKELKGE